MLSCETFLAPGPLTNVGTFLGVRAQVAFTEHKVGEYCLKWVATRTHTFEIEPTGERATTARDGTKKVCFVPAPTGTGHLGGGGGDLLLFYAKDWREARHACWRCGVMI